MRKRLQVVLAVIGVVAWMSACALPGMNALGAGEAREGSFAAWRISGESLWGTSSQDAENPDRLTGQEKWWHEVLPVVRPIQ